MPRDPCQRRRQVPLIDAAETGEVAGAVDEQLVPDPACVAIDDAVVRKIEALPGQVIDDVFDVIGDGSPAVVIDDGNDIAMDRMAVNRARLCDP
jgi:hypothetical protein